MARSGEAGQASATHNRRREAGSRLPVPTDTPGPARSAHGTPEANTQYRNHVRQPSGGPFSFGAYMHDLTASLPMGISTSCAWLATLPKTDFKGKSPRRCGACQVGMLILLI